MDTVIAGAGRHRNRLLQLLRTTGGPVRIATAYVTETDLLADLGTRCVRLLTGLSIIDIASGATSLDSLEVLIQSGVQCRSLPKDPKLHAKVYILGDGPAVVTSANFTTRGLDLNIEVGAVIAGGDVRDLIGWFDRLWDSAEPLGVDRLSSLRQRTAVLRQSFESLRKQCRLLDRASADSGPADGATQSRTVRTPRFFVCNTNRKELGREGERLMRERGYAAAWEDFQHGRHMAAVQTGDTILLYASQVGIIGIGRAIGPCEIREPDDPDRLSYDFDSREWRIPVIWLKWVAESDACAWHGVLPPTFHDVSSDKWSDHRSEILRHFFGGLDPAREPGESLRSSDHPTGPERGSSS
jgi:hypothetical protein